MLRDIPSGKHCFVDANIFYYHLVDIPPLSEDCSNFFERVEKQEIIASTSSVAVAEAVHKVMLARPLPGMAWRERVSHIGFNVSGS